MPTTKTKTQTKSNTVIALLERAKGATLDEICKATSWQPHSARAFLTGLRKKGFVLAREQGVDEGSRSGLTERVAVIGEYPFGRKWRTLPLMP